MKTVHIRDHQSCNYWHNESTPFLPAQNRQTINLVDAFNKKFIFIHSSKSNSPNVSFMIFLLGCKQDAAKYLIDFELKQGLRKIKFVESCLCDTDNLKQLLDEESFITIPKCVMERFLIDGNIHFRFIIKRKTIFEAEESNKDQYLIQLKATAEMTKASEKDINSKPEISDTVQIPRELLKSNTNLVVNNNENRVNNGGSNKWKLASLSPSSSIPTTLLSQSALAVASAANVATTPPSMSNIVRSDPFDSRKIPEPFRNKLVRAPRSIDGDEVANGGTSGRLLSGECL